MSPSRTTRRTGRRAALLALAGALLALAGAMIFLNERLRERWHIHRLSSSEEAVRLEAAAKLGEMRSLRAVPWLLELIREDDREHGREWLEPYLDFVEPWSDHVAFFTPLLHALHAVGPQARPYVERELARLEASRDPWPVRGNQDGRSQVLTASLSLLLDAWGSRELEVRREEYRAPCAVPSFETYLPPSTLYRPARPSPTPPSSRRPTASRPSSCRGRPAGT